MTFMRGAGQALEKDRRRRSESLEPGKRSRRREPRLLGMESTRCAEEHGAQCGWNRVCKG